MQYLPIVPEHRFTKNIPYGMFLYHKGKIADSENLITFFIVNNDLDIDDLLQYKQQSYTHLLIAIQNQQSFYDLSFADNIIYCKEKDNVIMMRGLEIMLFQLDDAWFNMDFSDIDKTFKQGKYVYFFHEYANHIEILSDNIFNNILTFSKNLPKAIIFSFVIGEQSTLGEIEYFFQQMNQYTPLETDKILIQMNTTDKYNHWKETKTDLWLGIYLVFDEKIQHFI